VLALAGIAMDTKAGFREFYRDLPFDMAQSDGQNFSGYAAVFDTPTRIDSWEGEFDEQIAQGAFARTLREKMPVLMFEHGRHPLVGSMPLGVINNAYEDSQGLFVEARLTDNWLIQPVRDAVEAGAISGMSFRFSVPEGGDKWEQDNRDVPLRTLIDLDVPELGPVVFPAYEPTTAQVRSMLDQITRVSAGRSGARSTGGGASVRITNEMRVRDRMLRLKGIL
jgi:HK97 family phage prohead protease